MKEFRIGQRAVLATAANERGGPSAPWTDTQIERTPIAHTLRWRILLPSAGCPGQGDEDDQALPDREQGGPGVRRVCG